MNLSQDPFTTNTQNKRAFSKILMGILIVFLVVLGVVAFQLFNKTKNQDLVQLPVDTETNGELPFNKEALENGLAVGDVVVTFEDLEKKFLLYYPDTPESKANLQNWNDILSKLNEDAILQNEGIKAGLYSKETSTKIDPIKVNEAKIYFDTQGKSYVSGEIVSVWFFNTNIPEIGLENAQQIAQTTLEDLRNRVVNNEITMEQAGELIRNNAELEQVDPAYQSNAYRKFTFISPDQSIFNDTELNNQLWQLPVQRISEVLLGNDFNETTPYPAYYTIIRISERNTGSTYNNYQEMVQQKLLEGFQLSFP